MTKALDASKIQALLQKEQNIQMRTTVRYLHSDREDLEIMRAAATQRKSRVYFPKRHMWYTITYGVDYDHEATANFKPDSGFVPCGTYRISKLVQEDGYL